MEPKVKKILIADDEKVIAELLKNSLSRKGFEVMVVHDGVEAKNKILEENPELVILDLMMPRLDGWEVLKWIRGKAQLDIPVIVVSGKDEVVDAKYVYNLEADSYLTKPIDIEELMKVIKVVSSRKRRKKIKPVKEDQDFGQKKLGNREGEKIQAVINLLHQKGLVTKKEVLREIDDLRNK